MPNTSLPFGVEVSTPSCKLTKSMQRGAELVERINELAKRTGKPVVAVNHDHIALAFAAGGHERLELPPVFFAAGDGLDNLAGRNALAAPRAEPRGSDIGCF